MVQELESIALPVIALILSGLTWTGFGYFSSWRKNNKNPEWKGFNMKALRDDLILGAILGVGSVVLTTFTSGDLTPILTAQDFLIAISAGFGLVAAVDKLIVGGILAK